jgi:hypothetical protein
LPIISTDFQIIFYGGAEIMKKSGVYLVLLATFLLTVYCSINSWANDAISILNYSLKPVGYVDNDRFLQTIYNVELKNNQGTPHSFNMKIVFFDKGNNQLKSSKKKFDIQANETKKYTDAVTIEAELAKKVATTKGYIEDIE